MPGSVYILGAGASRADTKTAPLPMPLVNDFFTADYLNQHWYPPNYGNQTFTDSNLANILSHYFGLQFSIVKTAIKCSRPVNVEEGLTFLDNFENIYLATTYQKHIFLRAKEELLTYIHDVIQDTPKHGSPEFFRRLPSREAKSSKLVRIIKQSAAAFHAHSKIISTLTK